MHIPFHKPDMPKNLDKIFSNSIKSGWLTTGSVVENFENKLMKFLNADYVIGVNSCTAALHLALTAKGFKRGQKYITPTLTFASTVECGEYLGMEPILIDSENDGFLIDLNQVEDTLKRDNSVKVIIPVHYGGEPVNLKNLWDLAEKYGLFILEDAAHAFETNFQGEKVGNTNHAAAFSFYANKNITTGGEGGALSTNNSELADAIRKLSLHGITKDGWNRFKAKGKWEYDIVELGYKYNLTDFSASFGIWQFAQIKQWQKRRLEIFNHYVKGLDKIKGIVLPQYTPGHSLHLFVIQLVKNRWSISRDKFIEEMNRKGIGLAVHYKPIHRLSYYKNKYDFNYDDFPRANELFESIISLPIYPSLEKSSVDYIINSITSLYDTYSK